MNVFDHCCQVWALNSQLNVRYKFKLDYKLLLFSFVCFSIEKVPKISSPVLVIHGTEDEVIDVSHGVAIYERCPRPVEPLFIEVIDLLYYLIFLFHFFLFDVRLLVFEFDFILYASIMYLFLPFLTSIRIVS